VILVFLSQKKIHYKNLTENPSSLNYTPNTFLPENFVNYFNTKPDSFSFINDNSPPKPSKNNCCTP
jgi:hypothetical protein